MTGWRRSHIEDRWHNKVKRIKRDTFNRQYITRSIEMRVNHCGALWTKKWE